METEITIDKDELIRDVEGLERDNTRATIAIVVGIFGMIYMITALFVNEKSTFWTIIFAFEIAASIAIAIAGIKEKLEIRKIYKKLNQKEE